MEPIGLASLHRILRSPHQVRRLQESAYHPSRRAAGEFLLRLSHVKVRPRPEARTINEDISRLSELCQTRKEHTERLSELRDPEPSRYLIV